MAERQEVDTGLEFDGLGGGGHGGERQEAIIAVAVEGDVVTGDEAIETERFGAAGGIHDHLAGRAKPDVPAADHDRDGRWLHGSDCSPGRSFPRRAVSGIVAPTGWRWMSNESRYGTAAGGVRPRVPDGR